MQCALSHFDLYEQKECLNDQLKQSFYVFNDKLILGRDDFLQPISKCSRKQCIFLIKDDNVFVYSVIS